MPIAKVSGTGRILDIHAHVECRRLSLALLAAHGVQRPGYGGVGAAAARPASSSAGDDIDSALAARIEMMNEEDVRKQSLLADTGPSHLRESEAGVAAARLLIDRHAELMRAFPSRLWSFVSLPLPHVEDSLAELRRGLDTLGMAGVCMHAFCLGRSIADERFAPLFVEMNRRGCALFVHPCVNGLLSPLIIDWKLSAAAGPLFEDAAIALHLIVSNVPVRYPNVRIIVPHLGGGVSMMLERLDNQLPLAIAELQARPSEMARALWYDTVAHGSRAALRCAVEAFGAARLVAGSDFPTLLAFRGIIGTRSSTCAAAGWRQRIRSGFCTLMLKRRLACYSKGATMQHKRALIVGDRTAFASACAGALVADGANVACEGTLAGLLSREVRVVEPRLFEDPLAVLAAAISAMGGVDIVVAAFKFEDTPSVVFDLDESKVVGAWDRVAALFALYQEAAKEMRERNFGRFIWTGPIEARQLSRHGLGIETIAGLGLLGLNKVIMGEMGPYGVTANSVLWDADAAAQADLARAVGAAVAWLASELAGYTSGGVLTIDGGRGERLF